MLFDTDILIFVQHGQKYGFNLIELTDEEVFNLDDILPRLLLKYEV